MENHFCLICYQDYQNNVILDSWQVKERKDLLKRFYRLLSRHLNEINGGGSKPNLIGEKEVTLMEKLIDCGMATCEDCFSLIDSFCDLFHLTKSMELLLNWRVWTLNNKMKSAQPKSAKAEQCIKEMFEQLKVSQEDGDSFENGKLLNFNTKFIENDPIKLPKYPRLCLRKCDNMKCSNAVSQIVDKDNLPGFIQSKSKMQSLNTTFTSQLTNNIDNDEEMEEESFSSGKNLHCSEIQNDVDGGNEDWSESCMSSDDYSSLLESGEEEEEILVKKEEKIGETMEFSNENFSPSADLEEDDDFDNENSKNESVIEADTGTGENDNEIGQIEEQSDKDIKAVASEQSFIVRNSEFMTTDYSTKNNNVIENDEIVDTPGKEVITTTMAKKRENWKQFFYRFKCPQCPFLHGEMDKLLQHKNIIHGFEQTTVLSLNTTDKNRNTQGQTNVIEILRFLSDPGENQLDKLTDFETIAKVKVPVCDVFYCDIGKCKEPFYTSEALESHRQLHGTFSCQFCSVVKNFLPRLSNHEIEHAKKKSKFRSCKFAICPRCDLTFPTQLDYIRHHISTHFSLQYIKHNCAICRSPQCITYKELKCQKLIYLFVHYVASHNISVNLDSDNLKYCSILECPAYFHTEVKLYAHIKQEHPQVAIKPPKKPYKYRDRKVKKAHSKTCFSCPNCNQIFGTLHGLIVHQLEFHRESSEDERLKIHVKCVSSYIPVNLNCKKVFTTDILQNCKEAATLEVILPKDLYKCSVKDCPEVPFFSQTSLELHAKLHGKFNCSKCKVVKSYAPDLAIHELSHNSKKRKQQQYRIRIKCFRCKLKFSSQRPYVSHHMVEHLSLNAPDVQLTCFICNPSSILTNNSHYHWNVKHFIIHHNLANNRDIFRCPEAGCYAYFLREFSLLQHQQQIHNLDLENVMNERRKDQIRADTLRHKGKRKSTFDKVCETCGKSFQTENHLKTHMLSHLGPEQWKFTCNVCSKKCQNSSKLREHMRTHSQEKPFVCQVCGAKYAHRHNLRIHVNNKHGDVIQDVAKKVHKPNLTSQKGIKRKQ